MRTTSTPMLSARQAALVLDVTYPMLRYYVKTQRLRPFYRAVKGRRGRSVLAFKPSEVDALLQARKGKRRRGAKRVDGWLLDKMTNDLARPDAAAVLQELRDADPKLNSQRAETRETEQETCASVSVRPLL